MCKWRLDGGSLLLLAACFLIAGCSTTSTKSVFYVAATSMNYDQHVILVREAIEKEKTPVSVVNVVRDGHRISSGEGAIFSSTYETLDKLLLVDDGYGYNLTIVFPTDKYLGLWVLDEKKPETPIVFYSAGNSASIMHQSCAGYGVRGTVAIEELSEKRLKVDVNVDISLVEIPPYYKGCNSGQLKKVIVTKVKKFMR